MFNVTRLGFSIRHRSHDAQYVISVDLAVDFSDVVANQESIFANFFHDV